VLQQQQEEDKGRMIEGQIRYNTKVGGKKQRREEGGKDRTLTKEDQAAMTSIVNLKPARAARSTRAKPYSASAQKLSRTSRIQREKLCR